MRLFVAIDLEEGMKEKIVEAINSFPRGSFDIKWVEKDNLHLTVKFLGEVDEGKVKEIMNKIENVLKESHPFRISIEGLGYFGSPSHLRTLWVDVKKGREKIVEIIEKMNKDLDDVKKDSHPPSVHVTLGRVKSGRNRDLLLRTIGEMKDVKFGEMDVKVVKLRQSMLDKKGPQYSDVKVFELG